MRDGLYGKRCSVCSPVTPESTRMVSRPSHHPGNNIGVHPVTDHDGIFRMYPQIIHGCTHHQWVGFADKERGSPAGFFDKGSHGAASRNYSGFIRSVRVRIGRDECSSRDNKPDGFGELIHVVVIHFTQNHIIRVDIRQHISDIIQCLGKPAFTQGKCGAVWISGFAEKGLSPSRM